MAAIMQQFKRSLTFAKLSDQRITSTVHYPRQGWLLCVIAAAAAAGELSSHVTSSRHSFNLCRLLQLPR